MRVPDVWLGIFGWVKEGEAPVLSSICLSLCHPANACYLCLHRSSTWRFLILLLLLYINFSHEERCSRCQQSQIWHTGGVSRLQKHPAFSYESLSDPAALSISSDHQIPRPKSGLKIWRGCRNTHRCRWFISFCFFFLIQLFVFAGMKIWKTWRTRLLAAN